MNEETNLKVDLSRLSKKERDEFKRLTEKASCESRVWKHKYGERYFTINISACAITDAIWADSNIDNFRWAMGIVFKTREEAEFALEKMIVKTELERYALEHNDPDLEKWNRYYKHFYIQLAPNSGFLRIVDYRNFKTESVTYFTSEEIAENAIKEIGEKRIMKYLFGVNCEEDE